jgi:hypothetical protein
MCTANQTLATVLHDGEGNIPVLQWNVTILIACFTFYNTDIQIIFAALSKCSTKKELHGRVGTFGNFFICQQITQSLCLNMHVVEAVGVYVTIISYVATKLLNLK